MRILVTGREGQVGWELRRTLAVLGEVVAIDRDEVDLSDAAAIRRAVRELKPAWIVNTAAHTAVDLAESEPELAFALNAEAPRVFAEEAARLGARLIHYSTDYVFDGAQPQPYAEDAATGPLSVYGRSKLQGEINIRQTGAEHWIFRTAWVYGGRGKNFLLTMLRLANSRPELRVVGDQFGAPNWSRLIAEATAAAIARHGAGRFASGTFHLSSSGSTSWHGFAEAIVELGHARGLCPRVPVLPIGTAEYPTPAHRPHYSRLSVQRLQEQLGLSLPDWKQALALCLDEIAAARG